MNKAKEEWREVKGHGGRYEVSTMGRVRTSRREISVFRRGEYHTRCLPGKVMNQHMENGEVCVSLVSKVEKVGKLVAEAFIDNPGNRKSIIHKDGNPLNNRVENLRWGSSRDVQEARGTICAKGVQVYKDNILIKVCPSFRATAEYIGKSAMWVSRKMRDSADGHAIIGQYELVRK